MKGTVRELVALLQGWRNQDAVVVLDGCDCSDSWGGTWEAWKDERGECFVLIREDNTVPLPKDMEIPDAR